MSDDNNEVASSGSGIRSTMREVRLTRKESNSVYIMFYHLENYYFVNFITVLSFITMEKCSI